MDSLLDQYRKHAADHGIHTRSGNAGACNKAYHKLRSVFSKIFKNGTGTLLFGFYEDPDPFVQVWAAAHTLEVDSERAMAKLEELEAAGIPHVSTAAEYTLKGWRKGTLRFVRDEA